MTDCRRCPALHRCFIRYTHMSQNAGRRPRDGDTCPSDGFAKSFSLAQTWHEVDNHVAIPSSRNFAAPCQSNAPRGWPPWPAQTDLRSVWSTTRRLRVLAQCTRYFRSSWTMIFHPYVSYHWTDFLCGWYQNFAASGHSFAFSATSLHEYRQVDDVSPNGIHHSSATHANTN
jgi:hypothetical protein